MTNPNERRFPWAREFYDLTEFLDPVIKYSAYIGVFITFFHIIVLKKLRAHFFFSMLLGIALCDMAFLAMGSFWQISLMFENRKACFSGETYYFVMLKWMIPFVTITTSECSAVLTFLLAVFHRTLMKPWHAAIIIILTVIGITVLEGSYYFKERTVFLPTSRPGCYTLESYISENLAKLYFLTDGIVSLIFSGLYLICTIHIARKTRNTNSYLILLPVKNDRSKLVIGLIFLYFLIEIPDGISSLWQYIHFSNHTLNAAYVTGALTNIMLFLITINSVWHTVACILLSSEYRDAIRSLFGCSGKSELQIYPDDIVTIPLE